MLRRTFIPWLQLKHERIKLLVAIAGISFAVVLIITSHLNFLRIFTHRQKGAIEVGLIKVKPGTDLARLKEKIVNYLPNNAAQFALQRLDCRKQLKSQEYNLKWQDADPADIF
jgi:hypothetical protein